MNSLLFFAYALAAALPAAPWIGDGRAPRDGADWYEADPAPEFKATFTLPPGVRAISLDFAAAGFASLECNNRRLMAEDGLDTLWSVYDKSVYFHRFPLASDDGALKPHPATNEITVCLGNGFYNLPPLRFWGKRCFREALAHGRPCFKLAVDSVATPLEWKWRPTHVLRNSVYLGADVDATAPEGAWRAAAEVRGPKGKLREWPAHAPKMTVDSRDTGKAGWLKPGERQVVDFGTNASGVPSFVFRRQRPGTRVEIVYGERLNADGSVNVRTQVAGQIKRAGLGGPGAPDVAAQRDTYICRGLDAETFTPPFTWHVFRYAEVRGATELLTAADAERKTRSMFAGESPRAVAPEFARLHEVCRRTFKSNLIGGVQSDCPGRERLGYGGDIVATCEAMCLNFDMGEVYLKELQDFADEAEDDGWITETAPYVGIADCGSAPSPRAGPISWALAVPVMMDAIIRHYPALETRALAFYPVCARYVRLMDGAHPDGLVPRCIGDHEALERAPNDVTATAHWHEFARLTASFARRLGKNDDAREFDAVAAKIKRAFQRKHVRDGVVANGTQSAQAIALGLGLVPREQVAAAEARLRQAIAEKDHAPVTGIFSTRYMLVYLAENGMNDLARRLVLHEGFPGWSFMLERNASTLWETWKESEDVYSNCHPMFGSVDEWILKYGGR